MQAGSTSTLSGWLVAKSKVFLKYWHPEVLDSMMRQYAIAAVRCQVPRRIGAGALQHRCWPPPTVGRTGWRCCDLAWRSRLGGWGLQAWVRGHLARKRFRLELRAYRDQLAVAMTFLSDIGRGGTAVSGAPACARARAWARGYLLGWGGGCEAPLRVDR